MNIAFFLTPKSQVAYIREGSSIRQGLEKDAETRIHLPAGHIKDGRFLGCINEGDFLWNILSMGSVTTKDMERARIDDIISDRYTPVRVTTTMEELLRHATEQNFVPVVDDRDIFMGIVTRRALLTYCLKNGVETESLPTAEYVRRES
ncbi:MAG: CBS domain-containing protein [Oscillospiraceae bacterium]|nr:MAG: CBS domain-containing protein [Oscillospiraceae bacterium]